ncbi:hypothetical protein A2U01_0085071, partial [Trifolium medium]|nr:hypothetical protein [Trifolium medium]
GPDDPDVRRNVDMLVDNFVDRPEEEDCIELEENRNEQLTHKQDDSSSDEEGYEEETVHNVHIPGNAIVAPTTMCTVPPRGSEDRA